jgi:initiation factor 1A
LIILTLKETRIIFKMPPKKGGKKTKRTKRSSNNDDEASRFVPSANAEEGQMYAIATKMLGNRRLRARGTDGKERLAIIPGKFKGRRNWVSVGMLLMLNIRDYQDDKSDVIYIYSAQDAKRLRRKGELDDLFDKEEEDNCGFVFGGPEDAPEGEGSADDPEAEVEAEEEEINLDDL